MHASRALRRCGLVLPALLAVMASSRADRVGDLLPVAIPGFGAAPGVSARSRLHPEYLPLPLTPGKGAPAFELFPRLGVEGGVDTAPGVGAGPSALGTLRPGLRVVDPVLGLAGVFDAALARYARDPAADSNQVTVALGLALPLGADRLTLGAAHVTRAETALGLAAGGGAAALDVATNDGRAAFTLGFGAFSATERVEVGEETQAARGAVPVGFERRTALRTETEFSSDADAPLRGMVLLRAGTTHYAGAVPGSGFVDTTSLGVLAGVATDPRAVWRMRAIGGVERERYAAGGPQAGTTPVYDIALAWTPDPLVSVDLDVSRSAGPDSGLGTPGSAVTTERLGVAEAFARDLLLTATVAARQGKVAGHGAAETDVTAGARWHLSRRFALEPAASLAFRHDVDGAAPREARLTVSLLWTP